VLRGPEGGLCNLLQAERERERGEGEVVGMEMGAVVSRKLAVTVWREVAPSTVRVDHLHVVVELERPRGAVDGRHHCRMPSHPICLRHTLHGLADDGVFPASRLNGCQKLCTHVFSAADAVVVVINIVIITGMANVGLIEALPSGSAEAAPKLCILAAWRLQTAVCV
jgi:hypothetical protein